MAERGNKKWTEEDKLLSFSDAHGDQQNQTQFLLQVIGQLLAGGVKVTLSKISLPGRTLKSLENVWDKTRKDAIAALAAAAAADHPGPATSVPSSPAPAPAPKGAAATPGNRKRTAQAAGLKDGADDDGDAPATPSVKRARNTPAKPRGKAKTTPLKTPAVVPKEEDEDEDERGFIRDETMQPEIKLEDGFHFDAGDA
ncbi:hypothetical protein F5Y12DRAFT_798625 [Xylaria sp. FL1777]|nr:hypothetical protein F5Y12DRAFT_798625 [Xylaria sp. FL1777]